jgi:hypothetical protein
LQAPHLNNQKHREKEMKGFKGFAAIVLVCLFCAAFSFGCAALKADFAKVETKLEAVDWPAVQAYWSKFAAGLNEALPVIEALFPGSKSTIDKVVTPVLADANTAVTALTTSVQAYKAGTLTEDQVQAAAKEVQSSVTAASAVVGQALQGKVGVSVTTAKTAAVPTK